MARVSDFRRLLKDERGEVVTRTAKIPFRPEYVLVQRDRSAPWETIGEIKTDRPICGFLFRLSDEAIALVRAQDPNVSKHGGFRSLTIRFDAMSDADAVIEATYAVCIGLPGEE